MVSERELFIDNIKKLVLDNKFNMLLDKENEVIDKNIAELSYWYASKVPGSDIRRHEEVVINSNDLVWIYSFAKMVLGADINRLDNLIIESGDVYYNYMSAVDIKGVDIKRHGMVVFLSNDPEYNYLFARDVKDADIRLHEKAVALSGNERFINKFMRNIDGADLNFLSNAVIRGGNPYWNYVIAKEYGVNIHEHGKVVYKSLNPEYNYYFLRDVDGADCSLHRDAIYLSGDSTYEEKLLELGDKVSCKIKKLLK